MAGNGAHVGRPVISVVIIGMMDCSTNESMTAFVLVSRNPQFLRRAVNQPHGGEGTLLLDRPSLYNATILRLLVVKHDLV